jgi:lipid A 3-O-deacylase
VLHGVYHNMTVALRSSGLAVVGILATAAAPVAAQEVFAGAMAHGVGTPLSLRTGEQGADVQAGVRLKPIEALAVIGKPAPYLFGSVSNAGETSFVAAGLAWTIGKGRFYLRPGLGLAVHDGPTRRIDPASGLRTDLGSRVLFAPELALGVRLGPRWSAEAAWVHLSHARVFSGQNPGLDMIGMRLNYRLR